VRGEGEIAEGFVIAVEKCGTSLPSISARAWGEDQLPDRIYLSDEHVPKKLFDFFGTCPTLYERELAGLTSLAAP